MDTMNRGPRASWRGLPAWNRRRVLQAAGGSAAALAFGLLRPDPAAAGLRDQVSADPFTLGLASGDPTPDGVVLWTRLAIDPYADHGGMDPGTRYRVQWEVAEDDGFARVVARGEEAAVAEYAFSVHAEVVGLRPHRRHWYRFRVGSYVSEVGSTLTAPAYGSLASLRMAAASCMNYRAGYFQTMREIAEQQLDLVLFLGDYLYEYPVQQLAVGRAVPVDLPAIVVPETRTLEQYRARYVLYRSDPDLRAAHRDTPWVCTWDDHEVANDYETNAPDDLARRAAGYRAYWEHMPLRWPAVPRGADARIYRRLGWGSLLQLDVLDTRQYRDPAVAGTTPDDGPRRNPDLEMLGRAQERWLTVGLGRRRHRWNLIGQQLLFGRLNTASTPTAPVQFSGGTWDGYQASQQRVLDTVAGGLSTGRLQNVVTVGGDVHCSYVSDVRADTLDESSPVVLADLTTPSISSAQDFNPAANEARQVRRAVNPTLRWADLHCGYDLVEVGPDRMEIDVRVVDKVSRSDDPVFSGRRFEVENGRPGFVG